MEPDNFPEDPSAWTFMDFTRDTQGIHKLFEDIPWSCPSCGTREAINPVHFAVMPHCVCENCYGSKKEEQANEKRIESIKIQEEKIPPIYQETNPNHPGLNYRAKSEIMSWNKNKGKGLWVVGDTRTGKTRSVCLLIKELTSQGNDVSCFFHGSFGDEILEVIRSEKSFRAWKSKIMRAPILFIDDLFASKQTERTEATLFDILDARITYKRPTIITTQLTGKEARPLFHSLQRYQAFFARIEEFFQVVSIESNNQAKFNYDKGN